MIKEKDVKKQIIQNSIVRVGDNGGFYEFTKEQMDSAVKDVVKLFSITSVSNRRELLIAFAKEMQNIGFNVMDDAEKIVDIWLKSN